MRANMQFALRKRKTRLSDPRPKLAQLGEGDDDDDDAGEEFTRREAFLPQGAEEAVAAALKLARCGELSDAARLCAHYTEHFGEDSRVLDVLAQVMLEAGHDFAAVQMADRAVAAKPEWYGAHLTRGRALRNFGEIEGSMGALLRAELALSSRPASGNL
eukprot:Polyplicarium_translucidae@DN3380_c3_g3_i2.p1